MEYPNSLLNSTLAQVANCQFTIYFSDITTLIGIAVGIAGVALAVVRGLNDRKRTGW